MYSGKIAVPPGGGEFRKENDSGKRLTVMESI
jgi:hypothetical protein